MIRVDDIDRQLITLLRDNGRYSDHYLSLKTGISRITVKNRIQRLLKDKVIRITVTPDIAKGYKSIGVIIGIKSTRRVVDSVIDELTKHYPVNRVARTNGRFDVIVLAWFIDTNELADYIINTLANMKHIKKMETFLILRPASGIQNTGSVIGKVDRDIIGVLREDGRRTATVVSKRLGLGVVNTQRRIKRLLDDGLIRIVAVIDSKKVDWYHPALLGISVKPSCVREVLKKISEIPNIGLTFTTLGSFGIIVDVDTANSVDRLYELAEDELPQIQGVTECELFIASDSKSGRAWWS